MSRFGNIHPYEIFAIIRKGLWFLWPVTKLSAISNFKNGFAHGGLHLDGESFKAGS